MPLNLVVQTAFLGDLLLSIPLLKKSRELWPQHKLGLVCRKGFGDFFVKLGLVDEIFEIEKGQSDSYSAALVRLRTFEVDNLISPHESLRTVLFCARVKAKNKITYKKSWNFLFFNQRVLKNKNLPDSLRQISLLSLADKHLSDELGRYARQARPYMPGEAGRLPAPPPWGSMSLKPQILAQTSVFQSIRQKFSLVDFEDGKSVLLFPGSVWATKRWTEEGFVQAGQALQAQGFRVIVMGGPGEEPLAERVAARIPGSFSLAGKTKILESAQLIVRAGLLIGNDSASTHLAAVCETPLIAIFGPTVLEFGYRPWSAESYVVQRDGLKCRPCGKHGHHECPIGTHECMRGISADEVLRTAGFILRPHSPSR